MCLFLWVSLPYGVSVDEYRLLIRVCNVWNQAVQRLVTCAPWSGISKVK